MMSRMAVQALAKEPMAPALMMVPAQELMMAQALALMMALAPTVMTTRLKLSQRMITASITTSLSLK